MVNRCYVPISLELSKLVHLGGDGLAAYRIAAGGHVAGAPFADLPPPELDVSFGTCRMCDCNGKKCKEFLLKF